MISVIVNSTRKTSPDKMASGRNVFDKMVSSTSVPVAPVLNNLNAVLADLYVRYVALKKEDCENYYTVFTDIFYQIHEVMKQVDPYYARYSGAVKFAGSHYDRLRINKPDEYDMDVVIDVPADIDYTNVSDIVIEPKYPGFVELRANARYRNTPNGDNNQSSINNTAYQWLDEKKNYILRSAFSNWFKSVVNKALNKIGETNSNIKKGSGNNIYTIRTSESGPAITLIIENTRGFRLDVDLVPTLRFPESRWPVNSYRSIPRHCDVGYWMVVPKLNKDAQDDHDEIRSWRISLYEQERKLIYNTYNLRTTVKLLKKLRDSKGMTKIASYYIKTLFLWEIDEKKDPGFWSRNDLETLFKHMLKRFHISLKEKKIPFFWNPRSNLIGNINHQVLESYTNIVGNLLQSLDTRQAHIAVAKSLLTAVEFESYQRFLR